ncbi:hypothetical protein OpiT1DRAFT_02193 [Opitutaceae bacterium TAV1]|nr:hypothetical protein OpiT1DRAFT_02193 [Opitutaceae bacterium TAV1]
MNKTLLLILCDFLLLNLLALTRWDKAEPRPQPPPAAADKTTQDTAPAATAKDDIVAVMRLSLEDERKQRDTLAQQLESTQSTADQLAAERARLEAERQRLERERAALDQNLTQTRERAEKTAAELTAQLTTTKTQATTAAERAAALERDLAARAAEVEKREKELADLAARQAEAQKQIENLNVTVRVAEQEKNLLRETAQNLRLQVDAERKEREKVQETTTQLATGVSQLAEHSADLTKEIRESRPINANTLFNDFLANRVRVDVTARRSSFLGQINRVREARTIFVNDGATTYALLHIDDTPFSVRESGADWEQITATYTPPKGGARQTIPALHFLKLDPRLIAVPVTPEQLSAFGVKTYKTALDPYRFPEAVLISNGGAGYGELPFKLDPATPGYVKVENRFFRRVFGDFSPNRGDLVLSKTGELLGVMVNNDYCVVVGAFAPSATINTGYDLKERQPTSALLDTQAGRYRALPLRLQ